MTIREVIVILNNPKMLDCQCNFKLTGKPRITVEQLASNLTVLNSKMIELSDKVIELNDKVIELNTKVIELNTKVNQISTKLDAFIIEVRNGFKAINDRIDNLVKKNNLIE